MQNVLIKLIVYLTWVSSIMVGFGEGDEQVYKLMDDCLEVGCDIFTIGQYLRPSPQHIQVKGYVHPDKFEEYKRVGIEKGFKHISSAPLVRSSYNAGEIFRLEGSLSNDILEGWQFSFITKGTASTIDFNKYISPIITALEKVGIDAKFNSRNDLAIDGKKISGNAQRMLRDYTLHHGFLLFDTNLEQMVKCLAVSDHKIVSKCIKSVRERVANISEHLQEPMDTLEFKQLMVENIMQGFNKEYLLTKEDISRINEIASEKFESWQWNYGESPKFNITKSGILPSGKIKFKLFINKGIIDACNIYGDFFGSVDTAEFSQDLLGRQYNRESVLPVLKKYEKMNSFYNIKALDLLDIII